MEDEDDNEDNSHHNWRLIDVEHVHYLVEIPLDKMIPGKPYIISLFSYNLIHKAYWYESYITGIYLNNDTTWAEFSNISVFCSYTDIIHKYSNKTFYFFEYVDMMAKAKERMKLIKEELIQTAMHPTRIDNWINECDKID
jgi:hypothetical protein